MPWDVDCYQHVSFLDSRIRGLLRRRRPRAHRRRSRTHWDTLQRWRTCPTGRARRARPRARYRVGGKLGWSSTTPGARWSSTWVSVSGWCSPPLTGHGRRGLDPRRQPRGRAAHPPTPCALSSTISRSSAGLKTAWPSTPSVASGVADPNVRRSTDRDAGRIPPHLRRARRLLSLLSDGPLLFPRGRGAGRSARPCSTLRRGKSRRSSHIEVPTTARAWPSSPSAGDADYLDANDRCAIHVAGGASAQALGCRAFPAQFTTTASGSASRRRSSCACVFARLGSREGEPLVADVVKATPRSRPRDSRRELGPVVVAWRPGRTRRSATAMDARGPCGAAADDPSQLPGASLPPPNEPAGTRHRARGADDATAPRALDVLPWMSRFAARSGQRKRNEGARFCVSRRLRLRRASASFADAANRAHRSGVKSRSPRRADGPGMRLRSAVRLRPIGPARGRRGRLALRAFAVEPPRSRRRPRRSPSRRGRTTKRFASRSPWFSRSSAPHGNRRLTSRRRVGPALSRVEAAIEAARRS